MLAWGWPLALAGLAALLVPVLLHLDRRRSLQVLRFAALRWIAAASRPRRTWRLVEWGLLALRLLLVAAVVAWLAQPSLRGWPRDPVAWTLVLPGATRPPLGEHTVWLAPGFPRIDQPLPAFSASTSSLLREFDASVPAGDSIDVRVPDVVPELDAAAIDLSREVTWTIGGESPPATPAPPSPRKLALRFADEASPLLRYVRAAIAAWRSVPGLGVTLDEGTLDVPVGNDFDAVIRVEAAAEAASPDAALASPGNEPDAIARAGSDASRDDALPEPANSENATGGRANVLVLTSVAPALLQSADVPRWLHRATFGAPPAPDRAPAAAIAPRAKASPMPPPPQSLRPFLAWLIAALFLLERLVATARRLRGDA